MTRTAMQAIDVAGPVCGSCQSRRPRAYSPETACPQPMPPTAIRRSILIEGRSKTVPASTALPRRARRGSSSPGQTVVPTMSYQLARRKDSNSPTPRSVEPGTLLGPNSLQRPFRSLYVLLAALESILPIVPPWLIRSSSRRKSSQAKDVRAAVGSRYGEILPAEGHLFDLLEPEDVVPEWKRWSPILLRPEGLYGTRPAEGGNKAAKLRAIREALRTAKRVWLATDCDREGQLIGQEILEHYELPRRGDAGAVHRAGRSRPSATHSAGQSRMPNMPAFTPPPLHAAKPIRSTTCR